MNISTKHVLYLLFCLIFTTPYLSGQAETYVDQLSAAPLEAGLEFTVQDAKYGELKGQSVTDAAEGVTNRLIWTLYPEEGEMLPVGTYKLLLEVFLWDESTTSEERANDGLMRELTIDVEKDAFSQPRALLAFEDARKYTVRVRNVSFEDKPLSDAVSMQLVGEVTVNRKRCVFNVNNQPLDNLSFLKTNAAGNLVPITQVTDDVDVAEIIGNYCATGYDLEYAFFDEESDVGLYVLANQGAAGALKVDALMRHNSTRLSLDKAPFQFRLFNLFRKGVVLFRYRAKGVNAAGQSVHSAWSSTSRTLSSLNSIIRVNHQSDRNWQANTSFAEEAKQLPTISYQDGTMRPRQNMTVQYGETNGAPNPSTEFAISQRSIYDAVGRPAATLLPTPYYKSEVRDPSLDFNPERLELGPDGKQLFDKSEIEIVGHGAGLNGIATARGAGNYYSTENNTDKPEIRERNAFVPDAKAFPLAVTRFTSDNTGRIRSQGNVGEGYQPGQNDTRYFYAKPDQVELDRLFGTNAGNADHYEKRATIDPNEQASVAYIDAKGRTVATALAGAKPPAMDALESYNDALAAASPRQVDILNNSGGDTIITTHPLIVLSPTEHSICYVLNEANYCLDCPLDGPNAQEECYNCVYDIEVRIAQTDALGDPVVFQYSRQGVTGSGTAGDCFGDETTIRERLSVGEYMITKKVWVSEASVNAALEVFEETSECISDSATFANIYIEAIDFESCLECDCTLPREDLSPECRSLCLEISSPCVALRQVMLSDVSPGGQYAKYELNDEGEPVHNWTQPSIFAEYGGVRWYQNTDFGLAEVTIDGEARKPRDLTPAEFIANWDDAWAEDLLDFHPEFCLLTWCEDNIDDERGPDNISSYVYDVELRKIDTWAEARSRYPLPTQLASPNGTNPFYETTLAAFYADDPLSVGTEYASKITARLKSLASGVRRDPLHIMEQYAAGTWGINGTWTFAGADAWQQDIAWRTFRDVYLGQKQYVAETLQKAACDDDDDWECLKQPICAEFDCEEVTGCSNSIFSDFVARVTFISETDAFNLVTEDDINAYQDEVDNIQQELADSCAVRCEEYAFAWRTELLSCDASLDSTELDSTLALMVDICQTGCLAGQAEGSSTVPEGADPVEGYSSFSEVLSDRVFNGISCDANGGCNPYMINYPPPADRDAYYGTLTLSGPTLAMWLLGNHAYLEYQMESLRDGCACVTCPEPASVTGINEESIAGIAYYNDLTFEEVELTLNTIQLFLDANEVGNFPLNLPDAILDVDALSIPAELNNSGRYCSNREVIEDKLRDVKCGTFNFADNPEFFTEYLNGVLGWSRSEEEYAAFLEPKGEYADKCMLCSDPVNPIPQITEEVSCEDLLVIEATNEANYHYERYYAVERDIFKKQYREFCLDNVKEELRLEYTPLEYHYTLYYYDQAGNLTMTVPPAGVDVLEGEELTAVADWRQKLRDSRYNYESYANQPHEGVLPDHAMTTNYAHNSFNEVIVNDNPDSEPTYTWYDRYGRVVASQDGRQSNADTGDELYSYTSYDELGRVVEVGEANFYSFQDRIYFDNYFDGKIQEEIDDPTTNSINIKNDAPYTTFETHTAYTDRPAEYLADVPNDEITSRNRVTSTYTRYFGPKGQGNYATHYTYDIAGNVKTLTQDFPELEYIGHRFKKMEYDYDLISGNVHALFYQKGEADQFTYRYEYDKLNRLSAAYSSEIDTDNLNTSTWKRDAAYTYYDYGPLRRTVIGQDNLQGIDMAYTAQGWLKVYNGGRGQKQSYYVERPEMNQDGYANAASSYGATTSIKHRDLYRYALTYNNSDYQPIASEITDVIGRVPYMTYLNGTQFYNGNIERIYRNSTVDGYGHAYLNARFDQLYRLTFAHNRALHSKDRELVDYTRQNNQTSYYYSYDGNGNLEELTRYAARWYDSNNQGKYGYNRLRYDYHDGTNRLRDVTPNWSSNLNGERAPFQPVEGKLDFTYDGTGNITIQEDANPRNPTESTITWNPYGKVMRVNNDSDLPGASSTTDFGYGPDQNRWVKTRTHFNSGKASTFSEYQVRDASGNTLATYYNGQLFDRREDGTYLNRKGSSPFTWKQQYLYGSSRLGQVGFERELPLTCPKCPDNPSVPDPALGTRLYELSDHLGNVTTVFGENIVKKEERRTINGSIVSEIYTIPQLKSYTDYTPFGLNHARVADNALSDPEYRFGFNGKERDSEGEWGDLTQYDYGFRIYNPGIGRFLSVDPLAPEYPMLTPYQFASNTPIWAIDIDGLEAYTESGILYYQVQAGQGPTQIAADLNSPESKKRAGYTLMEPVTWTQLVDEPNNNRYFSHITSGRYDANNPIYRELNMNVGDRINVTELLHRNERYPGPDSKIDLSSSNDRKVFNQTMMLMRNFSVEYRWSKRLAESGDSFFESGKYTINDFLSVGRPQDRTGFEGMWDDALGFSSTMIDYFGGRGGSYNAPMTSRVLDLGTHGFVTVHYINQKDDYLALTQEAAGSGLTRVVTKGMTFRSNRSANLIVIDFGSDTNLFDRTMEFMRGEISAEEFLLDTNE